MHLKIYHSIYPYNENVCNYLQSIYCISQKSCGNGNKILLEDTKREKGNNEDVNLRTQKINLKQFPISSALLTWLHRKKLQVLFVVLHICLLYPSSSSPLTSTIKYKTSLQLQIVRKTANHWCCTLKSTSQVVHATCIKMYLPLSRRKSAAVCLSVTISINLTTFLWFNCRRILISRTAVIGKPSFSFSRRTFFSATISP